MPIIRKVLILFIILAASLAWAETAKSPQELFKEANKAYETENFQQSIDLYEGLISRYYKDSSLFFNLGNAYYKSQQLGRAVVNYERALRITPRDRDIKYNLEFVNSLLKESQPDLWQTIANGICGIASLSEISTVSAAFFMLFFLGLSAYLFVKPRWLLLLNIVALMALLCVGSLFAVKLYREVFTRWAIVTTGPSEVRNGPGHDESVGFTVPEGKKVVLLGEKAEWAAIGLKAEGLKGWIEKKYLETI